MVLSFLVSFSSSKMSEVVEETIDSEKKIVGFHQMNLDDRLLKAIAKLGWVTPTLIQEKGIPLIMEGMSNKCGFTINYK